MIPIWQEKVGNKLIVKKRIPEPEKKYRFGIFMFVF